MKLTFERKCWYVLRKYYYYFIIAGILLGVIFGAFAYTTSADSYTSSIIFKVDYVRNEDITVDNISYNETNVFNSAIAGITNAMETSIGLSILVDDEGLKAYNYEYKNISDYRNKLSISSNNGNITVRFTSEDAKFNMDVLKIYEEQIFSKLFELYKKPNGLILSYNTIAYPEVDNAIRNDGSKSLIQMAGVGFIGGVFLSFVIAVLAIGSTMRIKSKEEVEEVTQSNSLATIVDGKGYSELITNTELKCKNKTHLLVSTNDKIKTQEIASEFAKYKRANAKVLLIDLDNENKGLSDVLIGQTNINEAIIDDTLSAGDKNLVYANYVKELEKVIEECEQTYDFIIVNGGVYNSENTRIIESIIKKVIICVNSDTKAKELIATEKVLENTEIALTGVILQLV